MVKSPNSIQIYYTYTNSTYADIIALEILVYDLLSNIQKLKKKRNNLGQNQ